MTRVCDQCAAMEKRGAKRGYYLHECSWGGCDPAVRDPKDERMYGPYCSKRCVWRAVHRGAIRTKTYTQPFIKAKDAGVFAVGAMPPSAAPREKTR